MDEKQNAVISRLKSLQEIIFELKYSNVRSSVESTLKIFDHDYPLSFNFIICHLIYIFSITQKKDPDVYFQYMKAFESKEREEKLIDCDLSKILYHITIIADLFESEFLLERMIEQGLITSHIVRDKKSLYFAHYKTKEVIKKMMDVPFIIQFIPKIESLSAYHWKLQRMLAHFGVNHKKIALILRNDDLDKLTKISEKSNFDINKTIPSLYERFSVARTDFFSLIDCAALYGSIKCFKFLLFNGADASHVTPYAVIGGNFEIIDLCCECNLSFDYTSYDAAIKFHQNEVFKYLYKNKIGKFKNLTSLGKKCVFTNNYELFFFLLNEGMELNDSIIHNAATIGNTPLISYILSKGIELPKNIFLSAVVSENLELAKYILQYVKVDMNARDILFLLLKFIFDIQSLLSLFGIYFIYFSLHL